MDNKAKFIKVMIDHYENTENDTFKTLRYTLDEGNTDDYVEYLINIFSDVRKYNDQHSYWYVFEMEDGKQVEMVESF